MGIRYFYKYIFNFVIFKIVTNISYDLLCIIYYLFNNILINKYMCIISLVLSSIDYCSSILYHIPNNSVSPLNRIIRSSIGTIFSITRFDHSITDSHQLSNWFPLKNSPFHTFYHLLIKQYINLLPFICLPYRAIPYI